VLIPIGLALYADASTRGGIPPSGCPPPAHPGKGVNDACYSPEGQLGVLLPWSGFWMAVIGFGFYAAWRHGLRRRGLA
ncbi:MAG: hypothetical protein L3K07_09235, partial [Thermoplasmata archaeon]|nr:hypothetical protein [Thermoplasmata archaeon]